MDFLKSKRDPAADVLLLLVSDCTQDVPVMVYDLALIESIKTPSTAECDVCQVLKWLLKDTRLEELQEKESWSALDVEYGNYTRWVPGMNIPADSCVLAVDSHYKCAEEFSWMLVEEDMDSVIAAELERQCRVYKYDPAHLHAYVGVRHQLCNSRPHGTCRTYTADDVMRGNAR